MRKLLQLGCLGLLAASQMHAAEIANLRNGFSIRHEHHEVVGDTTRLYMSLEANGGYVDVPTAEIENFEQAPIEPQAITSQGQKPMDLTSIVSAASTRSQVDADFIASVIRAESGNNPRAISRKA
jgi:hypothetical protein